MDNSSSTLLSKRLSFILLCVILFIVGLNVQKYSIVLTLFLPVICYMLGYFSIPKRLVKQRKFVVATASFFLFLLSNYYLSYIYNLYPESVFFRILLCPFIFIASFFSGSFINYRKFPLYPLNFIIINVSLIAGGIVWAFLSVMSSFGWSFSLVNVAVLNREASNFWSPQEILNGPTLDLFSYAGVALLGVVYIAITSRHWLRTTYKKIYTLLILSFSTLFLFSLLTSISLQARTPLIVLLCSLPLSLFLDKVYFVSQDKKARNILIGLSLFFFLIFTSDILYGWSDILLNLNIGSRFSQRGLDSPRYEAWKIAIENMFYYPWGGRQVSLVKHAEFVHNIWLDQWYDAGFFPMLLLLAFHVVEMLEIFSLFNLKTLKIIHVFVACHSISILAAFMQAPVLQSNALYFAMSCFFFGSILRLNYDLRVTRLEAAVS